jgi:glycosyltransferase involved in cell wall biosynthesis
MPVRVLYSFPDGIGLPGIGTTAAEQVRGVAAAGADVVLFCTSVHMELPQNVRAVTTLSRGSLRVPHGAIGVERAYRYHDGRVAAAIRRDGAAYDVVHCWPKATIRTARAASGASIVCLREVPNTHTAYAFQVVAEERERLGLPPAAGHSHTFDERALEREEAEYAAADVLLVPSDYARRTFVERGVPAEKLLLHRYGYDERQFHADRETPSQARPFTAIFVGRCEPRKGLHHALRAWFDSGASESGRFVICGSFEPDYRKLLDPMLDHPSVEIAGFVPDPAALMRESDVLLFPSIEEGSALVTYEAQACGCVLVVSEATGARCRHEIDGLIHAPGDVAALTAHLARVYRDRELLSRLRATSLGRIEELTWTAAGAELARAYDGVLGSS